MNRCYVCDVTDEDNPGANISLNYRGEPTCHRCNEEVYRNLEDLSANDDVKRYSTEYFSVPEVLVLDDNWVETALPEVPVE